MARNYIRGDKQRLAFYSKRDASGCLLWTGQINRHGYGIFSRYDRGRRRSITVSVHRVTWELSNGAIPVGMSVCHKCDVRNCIEPKHLFLGTQADNNADKVAKERHNAPCGERHYRAKVTDAQAAEIRTDKRHVRMVAREYGLSESQVYRIRNGDRRRVLLGEALK